MRRLRLVLAVALFLSALRCTGLAQRGPRPLTRQANKAARPNLVVILSDDQAPDLLVEVAHRLVSFRINSPEGATEALRKLPPPLRGGLLFLASSWGSRPRLPSLGPFGANAEDVTSSPKFLSISAVFSV